MRTCKGLKANHIYTQVLAIIVVLSSLSLKEQLVSASHLHKSSNFTETDTQEASSSTNNAALPTPTQQVAEEEELPSPTKAAQPSAINKKYSSFAAECDDKLMTVTGQFHDVFRGRIYAVGYPDDSECGVTTMGGAVTVDNVTFTLPLGQCGVQMQAPEDDLEKDVLHDVTLYIQYSSYLQQVIDEKLSLTCTEKKPKPVIEETVEQEVAETGGRRGRQGRKLKDPGVKSGMPKISNKIGEAWMELIAGKDPSPKSKKHNAIAVGDDVTLVVSTKVSRGFDARIVNCTAHDGSRKGNDAFRAQQLLDSAGCSVDKGLLPNFRRRRLPVETRSRFSTLHFATFPAFKFPERDHLHIKCLVAYCQGPCPQEACDSGKNHFGTWREKYGRISEVLVDTTDISNSLEVLAPDLEDTGGHHYERHQSGRAFPTSETPASSSSSLSSSSSSSSTSGAGGRQFSDSQQLYYSSGGGSSLSSGSNNGGPQQSQSMWGSNNQQQIPQGNSNNVCISPGTVILALVILGVVLVISATATLWFALKRSELKKLQMKHTYQHSPSPYYRFSQHW